MARRQARGLAPPWPASRRSFRPGACNSPPEYSFNGDAAIAACVQSPENTAIVASPERRVKVLFEVQNLCKRFGRIAALSDVSFHVRAGEVLGLIGPNGAGKSTLFECLAGVLPYDSGELLCVGQA